ncbi:hypothetical protein VPHK459_0095 [Vibrio phage K459]
MKCLTYSLIVIDNTNISIKIVVVYKEYIKNVHKRNKG